MMIDVGQVPQLRHRELVLHAEEPAPPRLGTEPGEAVEQQRSVAGAQRANAHGRSVAQPNFFSRGETWPARYAGRGSRAALPLGGEARRDIIGDHRVLLGWAGVASTV